jgi:hypothetical protein
MDRFACVHNKTMGFFEIDTEGVINTQPGIWMDGIGCDPYMRTHHYLASIPTCLVLDHSQLSGTSTD